MINLIKEKKKKECSVGYIVMKRLGSEARLLEFEFQLNSYVAKLFNLSVLQMSYLFNVTGI